MSIMPAQETCCLIRFLHNQVGIQVDLGALYIWFWFQHLGKKKVRTLAVITENVFLYSQEIYLCISISEGKPQAAFSNVRTKN